MSFNFLFPCPQTTQNTGEGFPSCLTARLSLQPKSRISLASDDSSLEYRRKSAGSPQIAGSSASAYGSSSSPGGNGSHSTTNNTTTINNNNVYNNPNLNASHLAEPYIYSFDEVERHPDGTVVLRCASSKEHIIDRESEIVRDRAKS